MRYLRRDLRIHCLAAVALLIQAWAAFAHIHAFEQVHAFGQAHPVHAAWSKAAAGAKAKLHARTFLPPADHRSPLHGPSHHDDSGCLICWAVGLGGSTVFPDVPVIALDGPSALPPPIHARAITLDHATSAFDARGPPARPITTGLSLADGRSA